MIKRVRRLNSNVRRLMKKILFIISWCIFCYMIPFCLGKYVGHSDLFMFWGGMAYFGGARILNNECKETNL